ncbi:MAG: hypothetical protein ACJ8DZ_09160 [Allosphingosinicella sp.]
MKLAVIVDRLTLPRWAARALAALEPGTQLVILNCVNTPPSTKRLRNGLYYLLNILSVRNAETRAVPVSQVPGVTEVVDFDAEADGNWQRLPDWLLDRLEAEAPTAIVKFGMHLLRVPGPERLAVPILSYHHGDPEHFRGRPAGFYELLTGQPVMGQIVQILSNRLDAGEIVAFAETKVHRHSYRATLVEAYRHSPLLLPVALANAAVGRRLAKEPRGKNYRLPANGTVASLAGRLALRKAARLAYGAFFEKNWRVSTASLSADALLATPATAIPAAGEWRNLPLPDGYRFIADPFFAPDGKGLIVEALRAATARGEILLLDGGAPRRLSEAGAHFSYPGTVREGDADYLVPEMSDGSPQRVFRLSAADVEDCGELDLPGRPRLLDPTLWRGADGLFLFANDAAEGPSVLRLWRSDGLFAPFREHPASPILLSPAGGRMAGAILDLGTGLVRLGQDLRGDYGDGLLLHRIDRLSREDYRETPFGAIRFTGLRGPHTLQLRDGLAAFDWYKNRFHPLAGLRRMKMSRIK